MKEDLGFTLVTCGEEVGLEAYLTDGVGLVGGNKRE